MYMNQKRGTAICCVRLLLLLSDDALPFPSQIPPVSVCTAFLNHLLFFFLDTSSPQGVVQKLKASKVTTQQAKISDTKSIYDAPGKC